MTASITREAALRLGLAAKELGDVNLPAFVHAVGERLGLPLTEPRLATLTVTDLREILAGNHAEEDCKVGVRMEKRSMSYKRRPQRSARDEVAI